MIEIFDLCSSKPYVKFEELYKIALAAKQNNVEAINISSYSKLLNEVNSRYVNLKFITNKEFIFFSNYDSPKSIEFSEHNQITASIYWNKINIQIRMKAIIKKTDANFNNAYFRNRSTDKNALAISSSQSEQIESYENILSNYQRSLKFDDLKICPKYWGGYSFKPYYFEFWEGHESRINKRESFTLKDNQWSSCFLQP